MESKLILYRSCKIRAERLFIVDSIEDYLSTLTKITITSFQYVRQQLRVSVKINKSQSTLDFTADNDYNYCSIQNGNLKICYYFIVNKRQLADSTIELELEMDTINTFKPSVDFTISDRTLINREHKDRFFKRDVWNDSSESVPGSIFDTGTTLVPIGGLNYYLLKDKLDAIPTPTPHLTLYTNVTKNIGQTLVGITINIYIWNNVTKRMKLFLSADNSQSQVYISCDGNGVIYFNYGGDIYYPGENEQFVIEWPARGNFAGGYTTNNTYTNPSTLFYGKVTRANKWYRKIDINSEGITPILYGEEKGEISGDNQSWYLIYKGNNPLRCYLTSDRPEQFTIGADKEIVPSDLSAGVYYYILPDRNNNYVGISTANGTDVTAYIDYTSSGFGKIQYVTYYYLSGGSIKVGRYIYFNFGFGFFYNSSEAEMTTNKLVIKSNNANVYYNELAQLTNNTGKIRQGNSGTYSITPTTYSSKAFSAVDRTDSTIVKIIKLPYKPADNSYSGWRFDTSENMLYLVNLESRLESDVAVSYNPFDDLYLAFTPQASTLKNSIYESKLLHSDFYQPKIVYDSFTKIFALERVEMDSYNETDNFSFVFSATNTINSRFLFTFTTYVTDGLMPEDYPNILFIARNNEVTIYNSDYISYIKSGFNYDVKSKQRQEAANWAATALSIVGAVASFASSVYTGGVGVASGIAFTTSAMTQLVRSVNTTAQAEANQNQKLNQLRHQKESVYGADDIDLMTRYTNNKAKMMLYKISDRMKNVLYDLFFYTGYVSGLQEIPNITSRCRFNFLACDLVATIDNNIPTEIFTNILAKYQTGVTFLHYYNNEWDWEQEYENWETALFN